MRIHGGGIRGVIDFSVNVNPLAPPKLLEEEIARCCRAGVYRSYPNSNYSGLKAAISYFYDIDENSIIACNGASEALSLAIIALRPRKLLVVSPSYGDYGLLCGGIGAECRHILMQEVDGAFEFDVGEVVDEAKGEMNSAIVVTNPNNPTGLLVGEDALLELVDELEDSSWLIVDEVYAELSGFRGLLGVELDNVIVVRSFTKVFGVPGLRLGFAYTSSRDMLERMEAIRPTWNIGSIAEMAFKEILIKFRDELWSFIRRTCRYIAEERSRLREALSKIGYHVYRSEANFLLLKHPWMESKILRERLLGDYGIHVRSAHTFHGLTSFHTRVAVRRREENDLLVRALEEVSGRG